MKKRLLSFFLCLCMALTLLPAGALAAGVPSGVTVNNKWIFANGNPITLKAGTSADKTLLYLDSDLTTPVELTGPDGDATDGYDLSGYKIYGGCYNTYSDSSSVTAATVASTSITMEGGNVGSIRGGGYGTGTTGAAPTSIVSGTATVSISGGTAGSLYGGGDCGATTGATCVTISGGTVGFCKTGHNSSGKVLGTMTLTMTGGTVERMSITTSDAQDCAASVTAQISGGTVLELGSRKSGWAEEQVALTVSGSAEIGTEGSGGTGLQYATFQSVTVEDTPTVRFQPPSSAAVGDVVATAGTLDDLSLCGSYASKFALELVEGSVKLKEAPPHTHAVSVDCSDTEGDQVEFTAWDKADSLPTDPGNYYLTTDVTFFQDTWAVPSGTTTLCLNGHTIKRVHDTHYSSGTAVYIGEGNTLNLCDCGEGGIIAHELSYDVLGVSGTLHLYGGTVTGGEYGVQVYEGGAFHMHGGGVKEVTYNSSCGVKVREGGTFLMDGGIISGNDYGVFVNAGGTFRAKGDVVVADNTEDNVWLKYAIDHTTTSEGEHVEVIVPAVMELSGPLGASAQIGLSEWSWREVDEADAPFLAVQGGDGYTITADDFAKLFSDNDDYQLKLNKGKVYFVSKTAHTHAVSVDCSDTEGDQVEFTAWDKADSLPTDPGNYYLTKDVTLLQPGIVPSGTTSLCLNGHTITTNNYVGSIIAVYGGAKLNLCDCGTDGAVNAGDKAACVIDLEDNGSEMHLYGGAVTGGGATGVSMNGGAFHIYGGGVKNTAANYGTGVDVRKGTFLMEGGTICGYDTGVKVFPDGTFRVKGNAVVDGNTGANVQLTSMRELIDDPVSPGWGEKRYAAMEISGALGQKAKFGLSEFDWDDVDDAGEDGLLAV